MAYYNRKLYLLYLLYLRCKKRSVHRQYWIHPIVEARYSEGACYTLFSKLQNAPSKFFNYFRMSESTFNYLLIHLYVHRDNLDTRTAHIQTLSSDATAHRRPMVPPAAAYWCRLRYPISGRTI
ncbi:unnamed protein product [Plutella xylostella]|uniref:(diamondback moth) hypothetical protein n=1 Tax=Plutella xylostella TaxID=51655 RepID=A0A8S4G979_PLUXY|nr:unnamed protein product [Plutella xylostella]